MKICARVMEHGAPYRLISLHSGVRIQVTNNSTSYRCQKCQSNNGAMISAIILAIILAILIAVGSMYIYYTRVRQDKNIMTIPKIAYYGTKSHLTFYSYHG